MSQIQNILLLIFCSSCLLVIGIHYAVSKEDKLLKERLKKISVQDRNSENLSNKTGGYKILSKASNIALRFSPFKKFAGIVEKSLTNADIPLKSEEFIILIIFISLGSGLISALLFNNIGIGLLLSLFTVIITVLWLRMAVIKRINKFNSQIGDALVLISNSLRTGYSFLQSMDMVRKEMPPPISREFGRTFQEMHLGTPTEEALENLVKRLSSDDLDMVVTAVLIQRQVGGNLAEVLDNISNTIRERIRIKGEIKTVTAQGRISGLVIGLLPLAVAAFLSITNPSYLATLFTHPLGWSMLAAAAVMEIIGIILIRKIINIQF